jgi:hypothetical protein
LDLRIAGIKVAFEFAQKEDVRKRKREPGQKPGAQSLYKQTEEVNL